MSIKLIENTLALIAPHRCLICRMEGSLLCPACQETSLVSIPSRCYRCHAMTRQSAVCKSCKSSVKIGHVWVAAQYENASKEILRRLKFERARAGALPVASAVESVLPHLPENIMVCHIPTANNRVRRRGYDQAEEIAKELCRIRDWQNKKLFIRTGSSRQVGADRQERFKHLEKALRLHKKVDVKGKHILLVDDVTTTGATVEAAAKVLKRAGAKTVDAAVFAQA